MKLTSLIFYFQSKKTQVPNHLKPSYVLCLNLFFLETLKQSLEEYFIKQNFQAFDAHVGDTCCQIRAYYLFYLQKNQSIKGTAEIIMRIKQINRTIAQIKFDINCYKVTEKKKGGVSIKNTFLESFLSENGYLFDLSEHEFNLTYLYILSKYKKSNINKKTEICYEMLMQDLKVGKDSARRLIHHYQKMVSKFSCFFIFKLLKELPDKPYREGFLISLLKKDANGRESLPSLQVIKIIHQHMFFYGGAIVLKIKRKCNQKIVDILHLPFFNLVCKEGRNSDWEDLDDNKNFLVVEGIVVYETQSIEPRNDYINRLERLGLRKMFLLNMAAHPQYPGINTFNINNVPFAYINEGIYFFNELNLNTKAANMLGCSINNNSLFFIEHIYCSGKKEYEMKNQDCGINGLQLLNVNIN